MGNEGSEPGLVLGDRKDAGIDTDLSPGQGKGIGAVRVLEQHKLPPGMRHLRHCGGPLSDPLQLLHLGSCGDGGFLAFHFLKRLKPEPDLLGRADKGELRAAGLRRRRAGGKGRDCCCGHQK